MLTWTDGAYDPLARVHHQLEADFPTLDAVPSWLTLDTTVAGGSGAAMALRDREVTEGALQLTAANATNAVAHLRMTKGLDLSRVKGAAITLEGVAIESGDCSLFMNLSAADRSAGVALWSTSDAMSGDSTVQGYAGGAQVATVPIKFAWSQFSVPRRSRNVTLLLDCRDKQVTVLMDDQPVYSAEVPALALGLIRPSVTLRNRLAGATRTALIQKLHVDWWNN